MTLGPYPAPSAAAAARRLLCIGLYEARVLSGLALSQAQLLETGVAQAVYALGLSNDLLPFEERALITGALGADDEARARSWAEAFETLSWALGRTEALAELGASAGVLAEALRDFPAFAREVLASPALRATESLEAAWQALAGEKPRALAHAAIGRDAALSWLLGKMESMADALD